MTFTSWSLSSPSPRLLSLRRLPAPASGAVADRSPDSAVLPVAGMASTASQPPGGAVVGRGDSASA